MEAIHATIANARPPKPQKTSVALRDPDNDAQVEQMSIRLATRTHRGARGRRGGRGSKVGDGSGRGRAGARAKGNVASCVAADPHEERVSTEGADEPRSEDRQGNRRSAKALEAAPPACQVEHHCVGRALRIRMSGLKVGEREIQAAMDILEPNDALERAARDVTAYSRRCAYRDRRNAKLRAAASAIDASLHCPISLDLLREPVILADGFSYERENIARWFHGGSLTSPITRAPVDPRAVIENRSLREAAALWRDARGLLPSGTCGQNGTLGKRLLLGGEGGGGEG
jgi:hypothetical protein